MTDFRVVADGLEFPEGPVALADGAFIVVEIAGNRVTRIHRDGRKEVVAHVPGGPNGLALGPDGMLYCVNNGGIAWKIEDGLRHSVGAPPDYTGGWVDRIDLDTGRVERLYDGVDGRRLRAFRVGPARRGVVRWPSG